MILEDSVSITGMKRMDFIQLEEIFNHVMEEDVRWDRKDYWDARNKRIKEWLTNTNLRLLDCKIKEKQ